MISTRTVTAYWTVQRGERHAVALTEVAARDSLADSWRYDRDPTDWTIEQSEETVPVARGEIAVGQGQCIKLDEDDAGDVVATNRRDYRAVSVFWVCPRCGDQHNSDLHERPGGEGAERSNPSLWFCERGEGLVLVGW